MSTRARTIAFQQIAATAASLLDAGWHQLAPAVEDLEATRPRFEQACRSLQDARPTPLGAQSFDGPGIAAGGNASSTERIALDHDPTAHDRAMLDHLLVQLRNRLGYPGDANCRIIARDARALWQLVQVHAPKAATDRQRRQLEAANVPECVHTRAMIGAFEPVYRVSDCGGVLPEPQPVCRFVWEFTRRTGRLPNASEMRRHHEGRRIHLPTA